MTLVAPSMLSADFSQLGQDIQMIEELGADILHIDVMDGQFVPNISFGPMIYQSVRDQSDLIFDCHLMVQDPERYIDQVVEAGADMVSIHVEATNHPHRALQQIKAHDKKAGIVLNPGTSISSIRYLLPEVDFVLLMSVNPGFGGQVFIESTIDKIEELAQLRQELELDFQIEVDGGVNAKTGAECVAAGADILVAGSYVFGADDRKQAIDSLKEL